MKDGCYPLTTAQYNIWLNEQYYSGSAVNVIHGSLWLDAPVASEQIQMAVNAVVERNDIFRLQFSVEDGEPVQYLASRPASGCSVAPRGTRSEAREMMNRRSEAPLAFDENLLYSLCFYPLDNGYGALSLCFHHILLDGYGMRLLADQIITAYMEIRDGQIPTPLPPQFLDHLPPAREPRDNEADQAFWREYLAELPAPPLLSYEKPYSLDRFTLARFLDRELGRSIRDFCRSNRVQPYTVFAAALGIYLGRVNQANDSIMVLPRLGRSGSSLGSLGIYTLAAPLRITIPENAEFPELCRHIQSQGRGVSQHKEYGYSRILSDLKGCGLLQDNLSEFTLNYQKGALKAALPAWLDFSACGAMGNHLTLNVGGGSDPDSFRIDYDCRRELFSEPRLDFFHGSLVQIIREAMDGRSLAGISMLTPEETARLRALGQGPQIPGGENETVVSLFKQAATLYSEREALRDGAQRLNFKELDLLSDRIAARLIQSGAGREQLVAFMLPRTARMVACMIGILKAGAAFLPIDPQYPAARIDYMLEDSQASLLVSDAALPAARGRSFISLDDLLEPVPEDLLPDTYPEPAIEPGQSAYCIYTSGTTGRPKGVLIEHRGLANITRPGNNPFNRDVCRNGRGIVAIGSICFDISIFEIFVPLLNGMFVHMAPEDAMADPLAIAGLLDASSANILHCTPTRLSAYLTEPSFCRALGGVDVILAAGEVLPGSLAATLKDEYGVRIYNGYGPTETTIGATITEAGDDQTIGRPIANTFIRIADAAGRHMPSGAAGEILIGGCGVSRGYLNRPELNRDKFVFIDGERFYRTGDTGCLRPDGRLMYLGRTDTQVKLRGLRIELAEIENCLRYHGAITMGAVIVREIAGQQHLAAFYAAERELPAPELKEYLGLSLAPYMIPDVFVFMEQLPATSNGKIDLAALRAYPLTIERTFAPPETPGEKALCEIFASVLQAGRIGAADNFFELGGTSLLAARVMLQARSRGLVLAFGDIFKNPTPRLLAAAARPAESSPAGTVPENGVHDSEGDGSGLNSPEKNASGGGPGSDLADAGTASCTPLPAALAAGPEEDGLASLDYTRLAAVLARNRESCTEPDRRLGNVLITGATGFLGVHILKELLDHPEKADNIYCLVRPRGKLNGEQRLKGSLFYYFEETDPGLCEDRLFAVEGDITRPGLLLSPRDLSIDTIIHSAANVSHYAYGDLLHQVNTAGVQNIISLAEQQGAAVIHISTLSVGGCATEEQIRSGLLLHETSLYVGQRIFNSYIMSKYLAEYYLLQAAAGGLTVKIMRVGNLQGRLSDGEFQMNLDSNAFARHLKSYALMKRAPQRLRNAAVNFSPVDDTARAIRLLAGCPGQNTVFHTFNPAGAGYDSLFTALAGFGYGVDWTDDGEFDGLVEKLARDEATQPLVQGILLEQPNIQWREVPCTSALTSAVLEKLGFSWGEITPQYLEKYFYALDSLGFFDR